MYLITILTHNDYADIFPDIYTCLCRRQCLHIYPCFTDALRFLTGDEGAAVCPLLNVGVLAGNRYADPSH